MDYLTYEIRQVAAHEHAEAGEVTLTAFQALFRDVLDGGYGDDLRDVAARTAGATVLAAVEDGRVLGTVTVVDDPASPWSEGLVAGEVGIRMLGVDPAAQGRGVGTSLVAAAVARARALGAVRVVLHTTEAMAAARRLYERFDFVRAPERDLVLPRFHLLSFTLDL
ncbi:MAG TPA: GNAT family N-acetyltransferase [Acidimicrobiales bacterium]|nr:GNAT family N-acetyltransferase [Acidimicrobiales bacterium]